MDNAEQADWSKDYLAENADNQNRNQKLKIQDGEQKNVLFLDDGKAIESKDYGKSILFTVKCDGKTMDWFIGAKKFTILREIAHQMPVKNKTATVMRIGKKQSDTRWSIKFVNPNNIITTIVGGETK